ncbi:MAM and LDL-receptor class A domain-containing protein 1-like [Mytilus edulis]|uniref:MAM and LDL-receptor class A domain-containing protein 1-like n=1 Tax=Mytilus edulis TaxID=6550 RepID=UPI0039EE9172
MRENRKRLVQKQKEYKEIDVETKIKGSSLFFSKSGSKYVEKVSTPKSLAIFDTSKSKFGLFEQTSSNEVNGNCHTYCVTAAVTTTYSEVREAARQIMQGRVSACTYNTLVYRFTDKDGHTHDGYDDDRNYGIGSRILDYLKDIDAPNITIISSRTPASDNCPSLGCKNGGFTLWNCTCYCPDVLTGDLCEQPISNDASCGGIINVPMGTEVTLTSPNYPNNYDTDLSCTWIIKGVENNILRGTIVDMEISNNDYACYHWMEIRYNMMGQKGPERCGSTNHEVWDTTVDEEMNTMIIIFDSFVGSDKAPGRGFKMNFVSIGTGCLSYPCKFGSCDSPIDTDSYVCTCDYGFKGINCTELSEYASIGCTAEMGEYCVLIQEPTTDEMNWDTSSKAPYIYSGPQMAKEGFIFLYLHSSGKTESGDKAVMSTQVDFPKVDRCLSFWYHMYSYTPISMGFMNVFVSDSTGKDTSVFFKNATQGKQWLYKEIDIPAVDNLKVSFVGTRNGWMSYMAVDDIWLIPGTCASPLTSTTTTSTTTPTTSTPTTTTPTTTTPTTTAPTTTTPTTTTPTTTTPTTTTPTTTPAPTTTTPTTTTPTTTTPTTTPPTTTTPTTTTPTTTTPTTTTPAPTTTTPTTTTPTTTTPTTTTPTTTTPTTTTPTTTTPTTTTPTTTTPTTTTPTTTTPTTTTNPGVTSTSVSYSCGFESSEDDCIFENSNNGDFDWQLGQTGGTPTLGTGPATAYSGDKYAYIEVTKKRKNKVAILSTLNKVLDASNYCLQFHYHMRGAGSGSLSVSVQEYGYASSLDNVFTANGNQGDRWMFASINIPYHTDLYIEIKADKGGNKGDIAIDEIVLSTGECTSDLFVCGFELLDESCIFRNKGNDDFDWKLGQLNTPTLKTGPTDAYSGNQYAYIEVNKKESGEVAVLSTDGTVLAASEYCLEFYYHMYGAHIGNLVVYIGEKGSGTWEIVFTKDGDQGNRWNHACLNLSYQNGITIEIEASKGGQTRTKNKGDIAIDDIQLSTGACTCQYIDSYLK